MSARTTLYNAIEAQLETVPELAPVGLIKHVSIWNGQTLEDMEQQKPKKFPHVFIEFAPANYKEPKLKGYNKNIKGEQNYVSNITLRVVTKSLADETDTFISKEELLEVIKYTIKGIEGNNFGPLRLISDDYEKQHGNLFESQLIFSSLVQESGVYDTQIEIHTEVTNPDLDINKQFI